MTRIERIKKARPWPAWLLRVTLLGAVLSFLGMALTPARLVDPAAASLATAMLVLGAYALNQGILNRELVEKLGKLEEQLAGKAPDTES